MLIVTHKSKNIFAPVKIQTTLMSTYRERAVEKGFPASNAFYIQGNLEQIPYKYAGSPVQKN